MAVDDTSPAGRGPAHLNDERIVVADDDAAGAPVASTLAQLAERLAVALGCSECCFYEVLADRDAVMPKAMWKLKLTPADRAWVGAENRLNRQPRIAPVFKEHRIVTTQVDDEELDPSDRESMAFWGEQTALFAPIMSGDELLGVVELVEHRERRDFGEADLRLVTALADVAALALVNARTWREEELKNRRLSALLQSSKALISTMNLDEVLQRLAEHAAKAVDAASAYIYEYDPLTETEVWRCEYQADPSFVSADEIGTAYSIDFFPAGRRAVSDREVVEVRLDDPDLDELSRSLLNEWRHTTFLSVPLVHGDEIVGLMEVAETEGARHFSEAEIELVVAIGEQAAVAIRNAQLYRREAWRNERLMHVLEISRVVGASLDPVEVVDTVSQRLGAVFGERPTQVAVDLFAAGAGPRADEAPDGPLEAGARAVENGTEDMLDGSDRRLLVPLRAKDRIEGTLVVSSPVARPFDRDERELVQLIANQVGAALENARLYDRLEEQAITDGLTGLYNHRFFYDRLNAEVARAQRYGLQLSVLMLDLDDFKRFNDAFGHQAGDRVLAEVGSIMREQLRRDVDIPCRYGGEEFAVILPHTPATGAEIVGRRLTESVTAIAADGEGGESAWLTGERLRATIATASFPGQQPDHETHVTVSVGVSTYPDHADGTTTLVANADAALYRAKREGKNRVVIFE